MLAEGPALLAAMPESGPTASAKRGLSPVADSPAVLAEGPALLAAMTEGPALLAAMRVQPACMLSYAEREVQKAGVRCRCP